MRCREVHEDNALCRSDCQENSRMGSGSISIFLLLAVTGLMLGIVARIVPMRAVVEGGNPVLPRRAERQPMLFFQKDIVVNYAAVNIDFLPLENRIFLPSLSKLRPVGGYCLCRNGMDAAGGNYSSTGNVEGVGALSRSIGFVLHGVQQSRESHVYGRGFARIIEMYNGSKISSDVSDAMNFLYSKPSALVEVSIPFNLNNTISSGSSGISVGAIHEPSNDGIGDSSQYPSASKPFPKWVLSLIATGAGLGFWRVWADRLCRLDYWIITAGLILFACGFFAFMSWFSSVGYSK